QIDQVIRMNHEWPQPQLSAPRSKRCGIDLRNPGGPALPHPRARGKNLHRVAAQFSCGFQGVEVASRNGGMNADSNAPAHPRWGQRFWLRLDRKSTRLN